MKPGGRNSNDGRAAATNALRSVLIATGGQAKVEELYRLLNAEEAAKLLGLAEPTVRDMTYRHELPYVKIGVRGVRYRLLDLIAWQNARAVAVEH